MMRTTKRIYENSPNLSSADDLAIIFAPVKLRAGFSAVVSKIACRNSQVSWLAYDSLDDSFRLDLSIALTKPAASYAATLDRPGQLRFDGRIAGYGVIA